MSKIVPTLRVDGWGGGGEGEILRMPKHCKNLEGFGHITMGWLCRKKPNDLTILLHYPREEHKKRCPWVMTKVGRGPKPDLPPLCPGFINASILGTVFGFHSMLSCFIFIQCFLMMLFPPHMLRFLIYDPNPSVVQLCCLSSPFHGNWKHTSIPHGLYFNPV